MSGWEDLFKDYDEVLDESTGQTILVEKGAKKYKLDKQGNIINPDFADVAPAPAAPAPSPFAAAFGGVGASSGGSGFTFGAGAAAPAGGGFTFGSGPGAAPAPAGGGFVFGGKPTASNGASVFGGGSGGSGFIFGSPGPAPAPAVTDGASKRPAGASTAPKAKRGRTNALRLTGSETGCVLIVGNGDCGQLGLGSGDDDVRDSLKPIRMSALDAMRICQVACGGLHTVALSIDGKLWSWGCNDDEVLGRDGDEDLPQQICGALASAPVKMISAGDNHTAALTRDGRLFTWGTYKDSNGYIGYMPGVDKAKEPQQVLAGVPVKYIASGSDHTIAVSSDGYSVYGWGSGEKGQTLRDEEWPSDKEGKRSKTVPAEPLTLRLPAPSGMAMKERHARVLNDNFVRWVQEHIAGAADFDATEAAELYIEHRERLSRKQEAELDDRLQVRAAFCGAYHTFLLTESGNVYACGLNNMGQLGLGSLDTPYTGVPLLIPTLEGRGVVSLSGGEHHSLALTEDGDVYAFGRGDNNQLGLGVDIEPTPTKIPSLTGIPIRKIASGHSQNVAVSRAGEMFAWGFGDSGQLCTGKAKDEPYPALVEVSEVASRAVLDVATGGQHTCVIAMDQP